MHATEFSCDQSRNLPAGHNELFLLKITHIQGQSILTLFCTLFGHTKDKQHFVSNYIGTLKKKNLSPVRHHFQQLFWTLIENPTKMLTLTNWTKCVGRSFLWNDGMVGAAHARRIVQDFLQFHRDREGRVNYALMTGVTERKIFL